MSEPPIASAPAARVLLYLRRRRLRLAKEKREEKKRLELEERQELAIQQAATFKARPGRTSA